MAEGNTERRKSTPRHYLPTIISGVIVTILFVIQWAFVIPKATAQEKLSDHETRISINATEITSIKTLFGQLASDVREIRDYLMKQKKDND